ncbi:MAG: protein kinase [Chloracidobacterium sp.]|uniref:Protein kinase n=1 Tax=Chloracidobacterium validum TaxID=2821543 RepID=A0ABX8BF73_9BACT|nr:protein kinase [Chloracidobacterium validum]QUW04160.1 protein kinase [Chloracidobacterium validum]
MSPPSPKSLPIQAGLVVGDYRLEAPLTADLGDAAWCGQHIADGSPVRVDVFQATPAESPTTRTAFAVAKLPPHPHLLPVVDVLTQSETLWVVTPYVPTSLAGLSLPVAPETAAAYTQQLLAALEALHQQGVVHGALTPAHVALDGEQVKLRGYGFAGCRPRPAASLPYASPWALEATPTARDDLWAVGVILFELLSGDLPFPHHDPAELRLAIRTLYPDPLPGTLPARLRHIVAHALERNERRRYTSAIVMREELAACAEELAQGTARRSSGSWPTFPAAGTQTEPRWTGRPALIGIALISLAMLLGIWLTIRHFENKNQWQMTPKTAIVAPTGGDFSTISAAVNAARPGMQVLVRPGVYRETVTLTKNVEIIADGPPGSVVVESTTGPCLRQQLGSQVARGLALRGIGHPAVQLDGGALTLEACDATATSTANVIAQGTESRLTLRRSRLLRGGGHGLVAGDRVAVEVIECEIADHAGDGIRLSGQARLIARDSQIVGNRQIGVQVVDAADARLERCRLERNGQPTYGKVAIASTAPMR